MAATATLPNWLNLKKQWIKELKFNPSNSSTKLQFIFFFNFRIKPAATTLRIEQQTAPGTSFCLRGTRRLWRKGLPILDPFQWRLMPHGPDLPSTGAASSPFLDIRVKKRLKLVSFSQFIYINQFVFDYLTFPCYRSLQWPHLHPECEPWSLSCGLRYSG